MMVPVNRLRTAVEKCFYHANEEQKRLQYTGSYVRATVTHSVGSAGTNCVGECKKHACAGGGERIHFSFELVSLLVCRASGVGYMPRSENTWSSANGTLGRFPFAEERR